VKKILREKIMVFLQLGKEIQPESIGELSSSPESGGSSLSQSNSLTEVINDWRRELEEKNCILREKNSIISTLEEQLKLRDEEIIDIREQCQSVELDRDKNCQMVSFK
jgi:septal ring factor EnvC (AmiA/AmiB activator)